MLMISREEIQVGLVVRTSDDIAPESGEGGVASCMSYSGFRERGRFTGTHPSLDFGGSWEMRGRVTGGRYNCYSLIS